MGAPSRRPEWARSLARVPGARAAWYRADQARAWLSASVGHQVIPAKWFSHANWGDGLNPFLIRAISGLPAQLTNNPFRLKYMVIGSIIGTISDSNTVVWGSGAISVASTPACRPKQVCAVRGPLTRELLVTLGIDVPAIYGDPALLMPRFYDPPVEPSYDYGIVPHYVDKGHAWLAQFAGDSSVCVLDVETDTLSFVRRIKQCRHVISSSLHGIICADAYGVPATWVEFSDGVAGKGFKFRDYFASIGRTPCEPTRVDDRCTPSFLVQDHVPYTPDIDLEALYAACPFLPE